MRIEELYRAIGQLEGSMKIGFKAINQRLDHINGINKDQGEDIEDLKRSRDIQAGKSTIIGAILGFIGAMAIAIFNIFNK